MPADADFMFAYTNPQHDFDVSYHMDGSSIVEAGITEVGAAPRRMVKHTRTCACARTRHCHTAVRHGSAPGECGRVGVAVAAGGSVLGFMPAHGVVLYDTRVDGTVGWTPVDDPPRGWFPATAAASRRPSPQAFLTAPWPPWSDARE